MSDSGPPIVNPGNYLSYLAPEVAAQYEVFRNVQLLAIGVYTCDMLSSVPEEVKMMRSTRFTLSVCAYWIARTFALVDLALIIFSATGPVSDCQGILAGMQASYIITAATTFFLFLRRIQAVFFSNKAVQLCFSALWLVTVAVCAFTIIGAGIGEIADTKHCIPTHAPRFLYAGYIVPLAYDSLVFLAISYKIITSYPVPQRPSIWRMFFPFFTQPPPLPLPWAILHGGQQYYLVSLCANIITALLLLIPAVPPIYGALLVNPSMTLTSSMACRVFRKLFIQDFEIEGRSKCTRAMELTSVLCQTEVVSGETVPSAQVPNQDAVPTIV